MKPILSVVPAIEQQVACSAPPILVKPSAPPMITISPMVTEPNKNYTQSKKRLRESKVRVVFNENVKEFRSKTCIIPNYCKYFSNTLFHFNSEII